CLFQMPEAVSAVAAELGPCAAGDLDTVRPTPALLRETVGPAGAVDGAPVKGAVLDDEVLVEMGGNLPQNGRELRRAPDHRRVDAVQIHVEVGEGLFRVDQGADNINAAVMPNAG